MTTLRLLAMAALVSSVIHVGCRPDDKDRPEEADSSQFTEQQREQYREFIDSPIIKELCRFVDDYFEGREASLTDGWVRDRLRDLEVTPEQIHRDFMVLYVDGNILGGAQVTLVFKGSGLALRFWVYDLAGGGWEVRYVSKPETESTSQERKESVQHFLSDPGMAPCRKE